MENNFKNIDEEIEMKAAFENLIFDCTPETIEIAESMINNFNKSWVQNLILYAGQKRIFKFKLLGDLFEKTLPFTVKSWEKTRFSEYLYARGLISEEDIERMVEEGDFQPLPLEEYEEPVKKDTIQEAILQDDVTSFVSHLSMISQENAISSLIFEVNGFKFTPINFACFCGSLNIIKYLLINNVSKAANFYVYAIYSGSEEVVEFLISQGYEMKLCLLASIQYHQNHLAKWLFENQDKESYSVANCISYYNTEMLLFLIEKFNCNCEQQNSRPLITNWNQTLFFHITRNTHDVIAAKYLNSIHNDIISKITV